MVSLLSSKAHSVSNLTAARRNRLRRALLETLEQRCLMAVDLGLLVNSELHAQSQTPSSSSNPLQYIHANLNEAALTDAASFLSSTLGSSSGGLTSQPWFPLINQAYDQWSQQNGLAFTFSTAQADVMSGLSAEGEGLVAEGEAGGPRLLSIAPNSGEIFSFNNTDTLTEAPTELVFRFDRAIDRNSLQSGIRITRSGHDGNFNSGNEEVLTGTAQVGDSPLIAIVRLGSAVVDGKSPTLVDDTYRVEVLGDNNTGAIRADASSGSTLTLAPRKAGTDRDVVNFKLELGAQVVAVVPQPVQRNADGSLNPRLDQIQVYFNNDDLDDASARNRNFYQLIYTSDSVQPSDDERFTPSLVEYDAALDMATLTFAKPIDQLAGAGTYRLRVGSNIVVNSKNNLPTIQVLNPTDPSDYFRNAVSLDAQLASGAVRVNEQLAYSPINANPLPIDFSGSDLDPGSRDINPTTNNASDNHINGPVDSSPDVAKRTFSFMQNITYGNDSSGRPLFTAITPDQMQRVREVFELYSQQLGIDFAEVDGAGADFKVVVGDLWPNGKNLNITSGVGGVAGLGGGSLIILDGTETWNNGFGAGFFQVAMHEVGHSLGLGHSYDLPPGTVMGSYSAATTDGDTSGDASATAEQFPGNNDVLHGQFLFRPDNKDIDLYKFTVGAGQSKSLRVETMAERLADSSDADTVVTLYKETPSGLVVLASNNDYFSSDSFLELDVDGGASGTTYYLAVTSAGNQDSDPSISGSGSGGVSQGKYQLLVDLVDKTNVSIVDTSGTPLDGDGDGLAGGDFNFWFRTAAPADIAAPGQPRIVFVDKSYTGISTGSSTQPFSSLSAAIAQVKSGDILRIVGNAGADGSSATAGDARAYEIGRGGPGNSVLSDGVTFQIPQGVTAMIDAGAVFKLRGSRITAGSRDTGADNSFSSIQILGTPALPVYFTSYDDQTTGIDTNPISTTPHAGDWAGIEIRNDVDRAQGRGDYERKGIFLNYVSHADIRYGGGQVTVAAPSPTLNPIYMAESRPTLLYNHITSSADAAMSADPDSFEETVFTEPRYQLPTDAGGNGYYRPDYGRVGPDIRGNVLVNKDLLGNSVNGNSLNGLFIRVQTAAGQALTTLNVAARFDDTDITYLLGENLIINGTPGGAVVENNGPNLSLLQGIPGTGGNLAAGTYQYKVTFVDAFGAESIPSSAVSQNLATGNNALELNNLPAATGTFVGRRIWRKGPTDTTYWLVAEIDRTSTSYRDVGANLKIDGGNLNATSLQRARRDGRLAIDPGVIIKAMGTRIEVGMGAQLIAEGTAARPIVFTSQLDDRYGAGGTLDTNNDKSNTTANRGDWGGLVARHLSSMSIDHAIIAYGGGSMAVPGGFASFNPIEVHQAQARIAHSTLEFNERGIGGDKQALRGGHGSNAPGTIFVAASQPVIIDNVIRNNLGAAINIDADSMKSVAVKDGGRQTGAIDVRPGGLGNLGPLVRGNRLGGNAINGMEVRGGTLTTESVWDDTDIVHVLRSEIIVPNFHHVGGLRLTSRVDESLVVKLEGSSAGFTASGRMTEVNDRIGGSLQIEGAPGFPVVLTSLADDSVGSGFDPNGKQQVDTNGNGASTPLPGSWRSIKLDALSNDRNVATVPELESDQIQDQGVNDDPAYAQLLGSLASGLGYGDENLRLGFVVNGAVASRVDTDVYSFVGTAGTQVWLDIDRTGASLDSVVELIDESGNIIAQSDNSLYESAGMASTLYQNSNSALIAANQAQVLDQDPFAVANHWLSGTARDYGSINPRDAGLRVVLPGTAATTNTYYVRVRSNNRTPTDPVTQLQNPSLAHTGLSTGAYRLQVRLQQTDEVAGSSIHYADVRYATNGVEALATPVHSPLLGATPINGDPATGGVDLGQLGGSDRGALTAAGQLGAAGSVNWFKFSVQRNDVQTIGGTGITGNTHVSTVFDVDYADGFGGPNTNIWVYNSAFKLVYMGTDSNIADDRAAPGQGNDVDDMSRGSAGTHDSFLGAQALPDGVYYVAVTNNSRYAEAMSQFQQAVASNTNVRLEPIDSVRRVAEDRFETSSPKYPSTAQGPLQVAFQNDQDKLENDNLVPFTLADLTTYVVTSDGVLHNVNAMTGAKEEDISEGNRTISAMALGPDGRVIGFASPFGSPTDANSGEFVELNRTGNSGAQSRGTSGLQTFVAERTNPITANPPQFAIRQRGGVGDGFLFRGLAFWLNTQSNGTSMIGVGSRGSTASFMEDLLDTTVPPDGTIDAVGTPNSNTTNIVYAISYGGTLAVQDATTSPYAPRAGANSTKGAGTNQREIGRFTGSGTVTGLAQIGSTLYAVSSQGELYRVSPGSDGRGYFGYVLPDAIVRDGGTSIAFTSLTAAPPNLVDSNGNSLADVLFGTTTDGTIYAFNTNGVLQNIFPGGLYKTRANNSPTGVVGMAFSQLDVNLWHVTDTRGSESGHGYPVTTDRARPQAESDANKNVLYFGLEDVGGNPVNGTWPQQYSGYNNSYNLPGGAKGAVESKPIDLRGYSADDLPTLYFNYLLSTQEKNAGDAGDTDYMLDSFRVYATADGTKWDLLATNNSSRVGDYANGSDEYDYSYTDAFGKRTMVQELFDNKPGANGEPVWRQARINLAPFAGKEGVRLRFEFASGGTFHTGDPMIGGVELSAVPAWQLADGQAFQVTTTQMPTFATRQFEFDLGLMLNMPAGASIPLGSTIEIDGRTYTFAATPGLNRFVVAATDTPEEVAKKVRDQLRADGFLQAYVNVARPNILIIPTNTTNVRAGGVYGTSGISANDVIVGRPGVAAGRVAIAVKADELDYANAAKNVRDSIRTALAAEFSGGNTRAWSFYGQTLRIFKYNVQNLNTPAVTHPLGITTTTARYGDKFGAINDNDQGLVGVGVTGREQNNTGQGVFIDDIIIGFAERGEQVINATSGNNVFTNNADYEPAGFNANEIETGRYQLEIRTGYDYGISKQEDILVAGSPLNYQLDVSHDTNYREAASIGLEIPAASAIADRTTFTLADNTRLATFEFDVVSGPFDGTTGTQPGNIPIKIYSYWSAEEVAAAVRNAINGSAAQTQLSLSAEMLNKNNGAGAMVNSAVVLLHGPAKITRTGGGLPTGSPLKVISYGPDVAHQEDLGDRNRGREDQGQLLISSSSFSFSSGWGVRLDDTNNPAAPRNLPTDNQYRLAPGTVVSNNIFNSNRSGGLNIVGDAARTVTAKPIGRVINNTFYGTKSTDVGVRVDGDATPTLLNNIFAHLGTGIAISKSGNSTVIGASVFHDNVANGPLGSSKPLTPPANIPLFVNPSLNNFYLAPGAEAIDSSLDSLLDRPELSQVRNSIALPPSPMLAPDRDIFGQRRVDDPAVSPPAGIGANVFKDRGATDRSDFIGLQAVLAQPQDNDSSNVDIDRNFSFVRLNDGLLDYFSILLQDGEGIGPDGTTVTDKAITLTENGRLLLPDVDYVFGYNANSRTVRLTPRAGIWRSDSVYEISVNNRDGYRVMLAAGDVISNGDTVTVTMPDNTPQTTTDNPKQIFTFSDSSSASNTIPYSDNDTPYQLAVRLVERINAIGANSGVSAYLQGSGAVMVVGAVNVQSSKAATAAVSSVAAVRDLAGNAVAANRANSLTQFTIVMPDVQLDYGDAPGAGSTLQASDGARHALLPIDAPRLVLGQYADADADGAPTNSATGDDNDARVDLGTLGSGAGVTISSSGPATYIVPAGSDPNLDGSTLTVVDTVLKTAIFEFSTDGTLTTPTNLGVLVSTSDTAAQVGIKLAAAVKAALLTGKITGLAPIASGSQVSLGGTVQHTFALSATSPLQRRTAGSINLVVPTSAPAGLADGQTFIVQDGNGQSVTFEINDVSSPASTTNVLAPRAPVDINFATATASTIAQAIATGINAQIASGRLNLRPVVANAATVSVLANDEDGVSFAGLFNAQYAAKLPVEVTVTSTDTGMLDAWIDWNADGDFTGPGEQVRKSFPVHAGTNVFTIQTPASAKIGFTAARFRLSTLGSLLPSGVGIGGEVEDYLIEVVDGVPPVGVPDPFEVNEDEVLTVLPAFSILKNDTDVDSPNSDLTVLDVDPFTPNVQPLANTKNGTLVLNSNGTFTYTPKPQFFGDDSFVYYPMDLRLASVDPVTVTIKVNPVNDEPKAVDDTIFIQEDQGFTRPGSDFWSNDWKHYLNEPNEAGQSLELIGATMVDSKYGTVSVTNDQLTFTPKPNYTNAMEGPVLVVLTVRDGGLVGGAATNPKTATSTLTINITPINDPPEFTMPLTAIVTEEDAPLTTVPNFITGIRPGPADGPDEGSGPAQAPENQPVTFRVTPINPGQFAVLPSIDSQGKLTYQLAADVNQVVAGPSTPGFQPILVEVVAVDKSTTSLPAEATSVPVTFTILPAPVNDAPVFSFASDVVVVDEDANSGGLVTLPSFLKFDPGPNSAKDETNQVIESINIQWLNGPASPSSIFEVYPDIDPVTRALKFQTKPNVNSHFFAGDWVFSVTVKDTGSDVAPNVDSTTHTFTISVTPVNDAPQFTMPSTITTVEDAPLVSVPFISLIQPGPASALDEVTVTPTPSTVVTEVQPVTFAVSPLDPSQFAVLPTIDANGVLTYKLAPDVNQNLKVGTTVPGFSPILVKVVASDTSTTTSPSPASAPPVTFTILPTPVNDAPDFLFKDQNPGNNPPVNQIVSVTEDVGLVTVPAFLKAFTPGPATALDEANETVKQINIQLLNPPAAPASPFSVFPTIDKSTFNLTFQTASDVNSNFVTGDFQFAVTLIDSGDASVTKTFTISVAPTNDQPSFKIVLPNNTVPVKEDHEAFIGAPTTQIPNVATSIAVGPATALDEAATQTPTFRTVSVDNSSLFRVQPTLSPTGMLEFVTAKDKNGQAVVVVEMTDGGPGTSPNVNLSTQATFTIVVEAVNDAPEITVPANAPASREDQGLVVVPNFATGLRPGTVDATDESGQIFDVNAVPVDPTAFILAPTIAADGTLRYQAAADVNSAFRDLRVIVTVVDKGLNSPAPNTNTSLTHTFTINITPVNDEPKFTLAQAPVTVIEDTEAAQVPPVAQTVIPNFVQQYEVGPASADDEELTQSPTYHRASISTPELFSVLPEIGPDGTLTFTTAPNKNGKAVVTFYMTDGGNSGVWDDNTSPLQTFTISLTPINDAPLFEVPAGLTVDEDSGVISRSNFAFAVRRGPVGADDESSQEVQFYPTAVDPSAFEILEIAADGTLTFKTKPNVNSANHDLTVRVYLDDTGAGSPAPNDDTSIEKTFSITVNPVNDAPVANGLLRGSEEDLQIEIQASDVVKNDIAGPTDDERSQTLSITQVERTTRLGGTVTPVFTGSVITSLIYRPAENAVGLDSFLYVVTDDGVPPRSGTGTISIDLDGLNDAPQFTMGVDQTVLEDAGTVTVANWATNILAGPPSAIDEPLDQKVNFVPTANNPALFDVQPTVSSDGTLSFKPAKDAVGTAVISIYAQDTGSNTAPNVNRSATSSFTITITPVNDAPVFTAGGVVSIDEDSGAYSQAWASSVRPAGGLLSAPATATDESSQVVDFILTPDKPELFSVAPTIDANGVLRFTPAQNAFGVSLISVVAKDRGPAGANDQNTSAAQTLTITINAQNDAPTAVGDTLAANENDLLIVAAPGLLANDSDVDLPADQISLVAGTVTSALGATVTINADGSVSYDPRGVAEIQRLTNGQSKVDTFTYQVRDLAGSTSSEVTVTVNIQGTDDAPVAKPDLFTVAVGNTINLDVLKNDTDDDSPIDFRTIQITSLPAFGTATVNQTGVVSYTPGVGFRGSDSFSYVVRDIGGNISNEATVTLTVNNAPRASNDNAFTVKNQSVVIDVAGNDTDPDGTIDRSTVEIVVQPAPSGTATVRSDGKIEFTPANGFYGSVQFSYFVRDNVGSPSNVADVSVEVLRSAWQNPTLNLDVNGDSKVSPIDALLIINYLNTGGSPQLPSTLVAPPYLDPSGDEFATAIDVLLIINYLNSHPSGEGESAVEGELGAPMIVSMVTPEQMVATVGGQIVREVESALAAELELCEPWHSEDGSALVTELASDPWGEEDSAAALAELAGPGDSLRDTDEVDNFFASL